MTNRSRILFAIPELDAAGPDRVFYELLTGLDRTRFKPLLAVSAAGGRYFAALPEDVEVTCIGGGRYPVRAFARAVDNLKPDLVFTTLRMNVTAAAASYIQHHRPPLIARQANAIATDFVHLRRKSLLKHRVAEKVVKWLLKRPDALVAQSNDMAHELARHARNGQVVATIGNPISLSEIERNRAEQVANFTPQLIGSPSLIAVGRLSAQKGFDLLLPAFARLREEAPEAGLTILGEGPDRALLEAQVAALGLDASVRMPGHSETALAAIAAADLLVSSSRYEGFPNIVLEAMALGTPVVATDCEGGTKELVLDEKTGIIASDISVAAIHAALSRSLTSDLVGLSSRAQLHVVANFDKDLVIEKYAKLFLSFTPERGHDDM